MKLTEEKEDLGFELGAILYKEQTDFKLSEEDNERADEIRNEFKKED